MHDCSVFGCLERGSVYGQIALRDTYPMICQFEFHCICWLVAREGHYYYFLFSSTGYVKLSFSAQVRDGRCH